MGKEYPIPVDLWKRLRAQLPDGKYIAKATMNIEESGTLGAKCNGEKKVPATVLEVIIDDSKNNLGPDDLEAEVIYFRNPTLGSRIGLVPKSMDVKDFAETLIDSSCSALGCQNGNKCAIKGKQNE